MYIPSREQASILDQRAEIEYAVPQWVMADGTARGVVLRALTPQDRMDAELAAYGEVRKGVWQINAWVLACQEVARGIARPSGITPEMVATWNEAVVRGIHDQLNILAYMAPADVEAARAAAMGGAAPESPPPPVARPRRERQSDHNPVDAGDQPAPPNSARDPGDLERPDAGG